VTNETGLCSLEIFFDLEEVGEVSGALLEKDGLCELEREVDPPSRQSRKRERQRE
jgi:hypothetical protein